MDGRPHPGPNAAHTWMGFSTGRWDGDMLIIETTHLKQGWVRRNGLPMSDRAHMTEYWVRNGDLLTQIVMLFDPVYLTEPLVKSTEFVAQPARTAGAEHGCGSAIRWSRLPTRAEGAVPAYLPGEHPFEDEFARAPRASPKSPTRGGAATMYPEFQDVVKQAPKPAPLPPPVTRCDQGHRAGPAAAGPLGCACRFDSTPARGAA